MAMTFVLTKLEKIRPGFNACFIMRYLLEKAESAGEALSLLMELPVASNCNILLADRGGNMLVAECVPTFKRVREAEAFEGGSAVCAVNAFTSDETRPYDDSLGNDYNSGERYRVVMEACKNHMGEDPVEDAQRLLRGEWGFMCQYDNEPDFETVWSSVFDLSGLSIRRAEGDPRKKPFITDDRLRRVAGSSRAN